MSRATKGWWLAIVVVISLTIGVGWSLSGARRSDGQETPGTEDGLKDTNRLAEESSPYLLLHAHNPVDWYPWGPEAFAKAKAENKPIFLSIGYSACFWCHVMERESFQDEVIAAILNEHFVAIKVDREERPDVDEIYMTALQISSGRGGWPLSMFLTPEGRPFFGFTYLPPRDRDGFTGFERIVERIAEAWATDRADIDRAADELTGLVQRASDITAESRPVALTRRVIDRAVGQLASDFDPAHGGFGFDPNNPRRPKFPEPPNLFFLLDQHRRRLNAGQAPGSDEFGPLDMVLKTLDELVRGGIRDQLVGGFHRYSTERTWTVPHFEKMLYDNAQLARLLVLAHEVTGDPRWRTEAESVFDYVAAELTTPKGGFASALDAETDEEEGRFYVWTEAELAETLGEVPDAALFRRAYGIDEAPVFEGRYQILRKPLQLAILAEAEGVTLEALRDRLEPAAEALRKARATRERPRLDDKVLTGWNGLMIAALAEAARVFEKPEYAERATRASTFLLETMRADDDRLRRTYRLGRAEKTGMLFDYAALTHGLLRLHEATGESRWLGEARQIHKRMVEQFRDEVNGGYFETPSNHEDLIARPKRSADGVLPTGNSLALVNEIALARLAVDEADRSASIDRAVEAVRGFSSLITEAPASLPLMLVGLEDLAAAEPEVWERLGRGAPRFGIDLELGGPSPSDSDTTAEADALVEGEIRRIGGDDPVRPGQTIAAEIVLTIAEGWHTYANPTGSELLRPTVVRPASQTRAAFEVVEVEYPSGVVKRLEAAGTDEEVAFYEGRVVIGVSIRLGETQASGPTAIDLTVDYQACNDQLCRAPARLDVALPLVVAEAP